MNGNLEIFANPPKSYHGGLWYFLVEKLPIIVCPNSGTGGPNIMYFWLHS